MLEFVINNRATILLVALLAAMMILLSADIQRTGGTTPVGDAATAITGTVVGGTTAAVGGISSRWSSLAELRGALERSERLQEQVEQLLGERARWEDSLRENERLRRLLDLREAVGAGSIAARIAAIAPGGQGTLLLDRGSSDGVKTGDAVVTPSGVLGKVILVSGSMSKVLLLTDPSSGVAVTHQEGRYQGVMVGRGRQECELLYLPPMAKVAPGDLLVTSGLDGIFPPGLPAGRIVSVLRGADGSIQIETRPEAVPAESEEVLVVPAGPPAGEMTGESP